MLITAILAGFFALNVSDLEQARDKQDKGALQRIAQSFSVTAGQRTGDAEAQYGFALAESYLAEIAMELKNKEEAAKAAETGIEAAQRAVALQPGVAEYHRILGTLCGQAIPANVLLALKYGKCATESIDKAIGLDPKSAKAYLSRGIGKYYMPPAFGGSVTAAVDDFQKAIQLDPKTQDGYLWLGIALRKANRNAEAHKALEQAVKLNPKRVWAKQQLEKTPAQ